MAAPAYGLWDPYLPIIHIYTSEHPQLYNKAIFGLPENYRYGQIIPVVFWYPKNCLVVELGMF